MSTMSELSISNIIGYDSHLPSKVIKLPLKYENDYNQLDTTEKFRHNCSEFGEVIDISSQNGHLFPAIQVGVSHGRKTIKLTPLLIDESAPLFLDFQALEIVLPHPIISKGTFLCYFIPSANEEEPYLAIDLIDESYLLITLKIEINDFIMANTRNRMVIDNFSEWVHISVPYSFELRSQPFFMKAVNPLNLVVSLKDGGLLHLSRTSALSSFDIFHFSDSVPLMSLNFVTTMFSKSKKAEVSKGLSYNAVVDLVPLSEFEFVALSVNKVLTVWNIQTHKQAGSSIDLGHSESSSGWLTTYPNKYFLTRKQAQKTTLTMLLPNQLGSSTQSSGYEFLSWDISNGKLEHQISTELDDSCLYGADTRSEAKIFKIQDFDLVEDDSSSTYYVLWKSNSYSTTVRYVQDKDTRNITSQQKPIMPPMAYLSELNSHASSEYYINCVFNSGLCDSLSAECALDIFTNTSGSKPQIDDSMGLRQKVNAAIVAASKEHGATESSMWYKFALICFEFGKPSSDSLSLSVVDKLVVCAQANGVGLYKDAHYFEGVFSNSQGSKLPELLKAISSKLSTKTLSKIYHEALSLPHIDAGKASELATDFLSRKISDAETQSLMAELDSTANILDEISSMISCDENWAMVTEIFSTSAGEGTGLLSKLWIVESFKNIAKAHENILVNLFVLFLLCEVNESVLQFLNDIAKKLQAYAVMNQVFDICFASTASSSSVEKHSIAAKEKSIFWTAAVAKNENLKNLISRKEFNSAFDYFTNGMLSKPGDFILDVVLELINRNEGGLVSRQFAPKLDDTSVNKFIFGIVSLLNDSPGDFYEAFADFATFEGVSRQDIREKLLGSLGTNADLQNYLGSIFTESSSPAATRANYFYQTAQLLKAYRHNSGFGPGEKSDRKSNALYFEKALALEERAIETLEGIADSTEAKLLTMYLRNYFSDALEIAKFDEATKALAKLQVRSNKLDFKSNLRHLCTAIIAKKEVKRLFSQDESSFFSKNYIFVDSIILEVANADLILFNALKCYELLYSWRLYGCSASDKESLGDRRGAAEALYIFIRRFKTEKESLMSDTAESENFKQYKLKILELYKVVLNTLKTFSSDEDRWIRMKSNTNNLGVIRLNELSIEYYKWIKEIESDFF